MQLEEIEKLYPKFVGKTAKNFIDLSGQSFGKLEVLYRTVNRPRGNQFSSQWVCKCSCENQTICLKTSQDLKNGKFLSCGCDQDWRKKHIEVEPGTVFGDWKVIERAENRPGGRVYYRCKCLNCNTTIQEVDYQHLKSGDSKQCQACRARKMAASVTKDETNKIYGYLEVVRKAANEERPRTDRDGLYWVCNCLNCGRTNVIVHGDYLRNGDTISCGCVLSKNEALIAQKLDEANIKYIRQYSFDDLTTTGNSAGKLLFDFGVIDSQSKKLLYLIEYDGIQHFQYSETGWATKEKCEITHQNDLTKNKYCFEHNIPLIRIPYNEKYDIQDLVLETTHFLLTPENEMQYYSEINI